MLDRGREREGGLDSNQLQEHPLDQSTTHALRHDRYDMMLNDKQLLHCNVTSNSRNSPEEVM